MTPQERDQTRREDQYPPRDQSSPSTQVPDQHHQRATSETQAIASNQKPTPESSRTNCTHQTSPHSRHSRARVEPNPPRDRAQMPRTLSIAEPADPQAQRSEQPHQHPESLRAQTSPVRTRLQNNATDRCPPSLPIPVCSGSAHSTQNHHPEPLRPNSLSVLSPDQHCSQIPQQSETAPSSQTPRGSTPKGAPVHADPSTTAHVLLRTLGHETHSLLKQKQQPVPSPE